MPENRVVALTAAFTINFQSPILEGLATIGKFDGKNLSLACGTTGGKVMVHSAAELETENRVRMLNVNRQATALLAQRLSTTKACDVLLIAAQTTLVAYDVEANSDLFFRDVPDGIQAMTAGLVGTHVTEPLAIVGGNCSVLGFDGEGNERYWTVTGDNVTAMALVPMNGTPQSPRFLLVGSKDFQIRIFDNELLKFQVTESDVISHLISVGPAKFAYGLTNGTVGSYAETTRQWRHKTKHKLTAIDCVDVDLDGVPEVVCGWSNGRFEVRNDVARTGEIVAKEMLPQPVTAIVSADYRATGKALPLVCTYDGTVRGFVALATRTEEAVADRDQQVLEQTLQKLQDLQFELQNLTKQVDKRMAEAKTTMSGVQEIQLSYRLRPNPATSCLEIVLQADNSSAQLHSAVFTAEVIFGSTDSIAVTADTPADCLVAAMQLEKDAACDIAVSVIVGFRGHDVMQVHELTVKLPKFAMYMQVQSFEGNVDPVGFVSIRVNERLSRVNFWLQDSFLPKMGSSSSSSSTSDDSVASSGGVLQVRFLCLRNGLKVLFASGGQGGEVGIRCDDIDVTGDFVQDLATKLNITELSSVADFPVEFDAFREVLVKVEEYNQVRMKLTAEMADSTQFVKSLVIKAEDSRILGDMKAVKKAYGSLYEVNRELMGEYLKRSNNHNELLAALKDVNAMIQKAGKLRVGQAKMTLVAECRNAIKTNNIHALFSIMRTGKP